MTARGISSAVLRQNGDKPVHAVEEMRQERADGEIAAGFRDVDRFDAILWQRERAQTTIDAVLGVVDHRRKSGGAPGIGVSTAVLMSSNSVPGPYTVTR